MRRSLIEKRLAKVLAGYLFAYTMSAKSRTPLYQLSGQAKLQFGEGMPNLSVSYYSTKIRTILIIYFY